MSDLEAPNGAARTVRRTLGSVRYDETVNVRNLELIELAKTRPSSGTEEHARIWEEVGDLLESIPIIGLLQPPTISRDGALLFGFRRCAALLVLYGSEHELDWNVSDLSEAQAKAANLAENSARRAVPTWRAAERLHELKHVYSWRTESIAQAVGYSVSHAENLIRLKTKLAPALFELWKKWDKTMPLETLLSLCPLQHDEQIAEWERLQAGKKPRGKRSAKPQSSEVPEGSGQSPSEKPLGVEEGERLLQLVYEELPRVKNTPLSQWYAGAEVALQAMLGRGPFTKPAPIQEPAPQTSRPAARPAPKKAAKPAPKKAAQPAPKKTAQPAPKKTAKGGKQ